MFTVLTKYGKTKLFSLFSVQSMKVGKEKKKKTFSQTRQCNINDGGIRSITIQSPRHC